MRRSRAVTHLQEMADESTRFASADFLDWPVVSLWAVGQFLEAGETIDDAHVVVVLDLPPADVPYLSYPQDARGVEDVLRLGKRPIHPYYRPAAWPAWTAAYPRVVRFWSADGGADGAVLDRLRRGTTAGLPVVAPSDAELQAQLRTELDVAREHLQRTLDRYWDHDWRRTHRGDGTYPDDHLHRAAEGFLDLERALSARAG